MPALVNPKLPTGEIEVFVRAVEVLGPADELPLQVFGDQEYPEETRLRYRFLDLRRQALHDNMMLRSHVVQSIRRRMWDQGFTEHQTPIITASSPEGARDFLVPSRLHPGKFYALPQAPQQFKQLLMVSGFDRYFQIAPCFRDEDPRADRSPTDFYQLDVEMSFVEQDDVFGAVEPVIRGVFEEFGNGRSVDQVWPRISACRGGACGTAPTSRICAARSRCRWCPTISPAPVLRFSPSSWSRTGTEVRAIPAPGGGSRKFCDRMNAFAQKEGPAGDGVYLLARGRGRLGHAKPPARSPRTSARSGPRRSACNLASATGDAAFFLGGKPEAFERVAGKARTVIGEELGLTDKDRFAFAWIVDFPMYEKTDEGKIDFSHNPFSMPQGGLAALDGDPLKVHAFQYDLACNGYELISGGIRNHRPEIMVKAFELAGYPPEEVEKRFGGMLNAFRYGAPPHGGCAAGIDRIVMLLADEANIREVILFPMNQRAEDLMMGAPSEPTNEQLRELGLRVVPKDA